MNSNISELRRLNDDELLELYEEKKEAMYTLRQNSASGELADTNSTKRTRHDIARILTILRERELAQEITQGKDS